MPGATSRWAIWLLAHDIALNTPGTLSVGSLSGRDIALLPRGTQSIGAITATGRVLLANYDMSLFDHNPLSPLYFAQLFTRPLIATNGPITVSGSISAGSFTAVSRGDIGLRNITTTKAGLASGAIRIEAGGAATLGNLASIDLSSGVGISVTAGTALTMGSGSAGDSGLALSSGGVRSNPLISQQGLGQLSVSSGGNREFGRGNLWAWRRAGQAPLALTVGDVRVRSAMRGSPRVRRWWRAVSPAANPHCFAAWVASH